MTFAQIIRGKRKELQISQKDLAARIKKEDGSTISPQYLNDIERERRNPPPGYIIDQLAEVLDIPADDLYFLAGQMPSDLRSSTYEPKKVRQAFQAFRRKLG